MRVLCMHACMKPSPGPTRFEASINWGPQLVCRSSRDWLMWASTRTSCTGQDPTELTALPHSAMDCLR